MIGSICSWDFVMWISVFSSLVAWHKTEMADCMSPALNCWTRTAPSSPPRSTCTLMSRVRGQVVHPDKSELTVRGQRQVNVHYRGLRFFVCTEGFSRQQYWPSGPCSFMQLHTRCSVFMSHHCMNKGNRFKYTWRTAWVCFSFPSQ